MKTFYISDTHFHHKNIIRLANRPFDSVEDMHRTMIDNWNSAVSDEDEVWMLGDFTFSKDFNLDVFPILSTLKGKKHLIVGNHDHEPVRTSSLWESVTYGHRRIKDDGVDVILCHYPLYDWDKSFRGSIHIFGHVHGRPTHHIHDNNAFDAGVEVIGYTPRTLSWMIANGTSAKQRKANHEMVDNPALV